MSTVVNFNDGKPGNVNVAGGKKTGEVTVSVFEDKRNRNPYFVISSSCDKVLPVSYVIEDTLSSY